MHKAVQAPKNKIRRTGDDRAISVFIFVVMTFVFFVTAYPFWYSLVLSFSEGNDALRGGIYLWPRTFTLANYNAVFGISYIPTAFLVSVARTVLGTVVAVLFTGVFAYALSHSKLMFRNFYMTAMLITMYFSGGLIPFYALLRALGLMNTFWVYIVPNLFSSFNAVMMINFFREIPDSLEEAAHIDGANDLTIFFRIILPCSKPLLATMALYSGVWHWNAWTDTAFYVSDPSLRTLSYVLINLIKQTESAAQTLVGRVNVSTQSYNSMTLRPAAMIVCILPIVMVYPFLQKYFVKGIMLGSVKE